MEEFTTVWLGPEQYENTNTFKNVTYGQSVSEFSENPAMYLKEDKPTVSNSVPEFSIKSEYMIKEEVMPYPDPYSDASQPSPEQDYMTTPQPSPNPMQTIVPNTYNPLTYTSKTNISPNHPYIGYATSADVQFVSKSPPNNLYASYSGQTYRTSPDLQYRTSPDPQYRTSPDLQYRTSPDLAYRTSPDLPYSPSPEPTYNSSARTSPVQQYTSHSQASPDQTCQPSRTPPTMQYNQTTNKSPDLPYLAHSQLSSDTVYNDTQPSIVYNSTSCTPPNISYDPAGNPQSNYSMNIQYFHPAYGANQPNQINNYQQQHIKQERLENYPLSNSQPKSKTPGQNPSSSYIIPNSYPNYMNNSSNSFPNMNFNPDFQHQFKGYQPYKQMPGSSSFYNPAPAPKKLSKWKEKVVKSRQVCVVCGDRSSGWHYNVLACEGCKGFFRRSIAKKLKYSCKFGGNCGIDKSSRKRCQACRLRKCHFKGMKPESVEENTKPKKTKKIVQEVFSNIWNDPLQPSNIGTEE